MTFRPAPESGLLFGIDSSQLEGDHAEQGESHFQVRFYTGNYAARQQQANFDRCICYVEQHFNSFADPLVGYTVVVTGSNASRTSKEWGRWYAQTVSNEFLVPLGGDVGIQVGGCKGRGDANVRLTRMPAILLEPLAASNPRHALWIRSESGQLRLAQILAESIVHFFPNGGLVAFSVGHKYKTSQPSDRGASVFGGGVEADFAERVLIKAKDLLESAPEKLSGASIRVIQNNELVWGTNLQETTQVTWNSVRRLLWIRE